MTPQTRPNPYVGPRAFQYGETLYGRDREVVELLDLLIAERIVLLYSPSGAGKTSLLQAGLIPALEQEGFRVLPVMRVSVEPSLVLDSSPMANRYILSLLLSLEEGLPVEHQMPLTELASMEFADYLDRRQRVAGGSDPEVLIFDQFEEILTVDPTDRAAKEAFFAQVGAALRHRQRWALFAMREEYPAGLDPYLRPIPTRLSTTYRLELLGEEAARLAVQRPARQARVDFTDAAATKLINDLRRVRIQRPEGTTAEQLGMYVEPVQLQVVCRRLWEKLALDATQIGAENVEAVGDVDSALEGYYAERVTAVSGATGVRERAIREWVDRQLITEQGIRGQVLQGHEASQGLANRAIMPLVDAHLVRAEKRRGATWFELAHDRLIEPIRKNNAAWYQANLSALQRQAALWEEQHRSPGLLLRGEALEDAERWATAHDDQMTPTERDFLAACWEARAIAAREKRQVRRIRSLAIGTSVICVIAMIAFLIAGYQFLKARAERDRAENLLNTSIAMSLTAQALHQLGDQHQQDESNALLARQAFMFHQWGHGHVLAQIDSVLRTVLSSSNFSSVLRGHEFGVHSVAFSPDSNRLASGSSDSTIRLWELGTPEAEPIVLRGHTGKVWSVLFSPDGKRLASGGEDSTIRLWELGTPEAEPIVLRGHAGGVQSVAFSPDGKRLASGGGDTIRLWELGTPEAEPIVLRGHTRGVRSVAFSPDGKRLASDSEYANVIQLWELGTPEAEPTVLRGHAGESRVGSVAFSPDGKRLASGSGYAIQLWELGTPEAEPTVLRGHTHEVWSVSFSPDGKRLASGSEDRTIRLWELGTPEAKSTVLRGHTDGVTSVAFSPDGKRLASGGEDGIRLWELGMPEAKSTVLRDSAGGVASVAFSPDGKRLASGGEDGIRLWELGTPEAKPTVLRDSAGGVASVAFSPDGKRLAAGSWDRTIRLWELGTPEAEPTVLHGHAVPVQSVAFSPDGKHLASGSGDAVRLWELSTPEAESTVPPGHEYGVRSVAFSPDGTHLASGIFWDSIIQLWELGTPEAEPTVLRGHAGEGGVQSVAFSPDGKRLAAGSEDKSIRIWAITETLADRVCAKVRRNLTLDEWRRSVGLGIPYRRTCSNLPIHPSFVAEGEWLAQQGKVKEALRVYTEAQAPEPRLRISAQSWNELCWHGSLWGHPADVRHACEQAVTLAPEDRSKRDSRGLARALTGDIEGAIADFQAFLVWTRDEQQKTQRQHWIDELRAGRNPFTPEVIKELRTP